MSPERDRSSRLGRATQLRNCLAPAATLQASLSSLVADTRLGVAIALNRDATRSALIPPRPNSHISTQSTLNNSSASRYILTLSDHAAMAGWPRARVCLLQLSPPAQRHAVSTSRPCSLYLASPVCTTSVHVLGDSAWANKHKHVSRLQVAP